MSLTNRLARRRFLVHLGLVSTGVLVAACAPTPTPQPTQAPAGQAPVATQVPQKTALPATKTPVTLTYWGQLAGKLTTLVTNHNEAPIFQELEKRTGVHIDYQHPPAGQQVSEQFNLLVASGNYPDIIEWNWLSFPGGPEKAIKDKVILRLNEVVDQYAPNLKKMYAGRPDRRKAATTDEGNQYVFPFMREINCWTGLVTRGDWMEKLGLQVPTTVDELHTMLAAYKTKDPNGNDKADEWPFGPGLGTNPVSAYANHAIVGAWGIAWNYYNEKGTVKYGPAQPAFKEFLRMMVAWYKEGLIDPEFVSMDKKAVDARITGGQWGTWVGAAAAGMGAYLLLMEKTDPKYSLVGLPYPTLQKGERPLLGQFANDYPGTASAAITTSCKRVREAAEWLDYPYGPEGHMLVNFGVEGVGYNMVNGEPKMTELALGAEAPKYRRSLDAGPFIQDLRAYLASLTFPTQLAAVKTWTEPVNEMHLPPMSPTVEESKRMATITQEMNTLFSESVLKVLTGAVPVEDWDRVVEQMKKIGLDEAIKINQAALERYEKR
mgnify:CR=1 FL=1